MPAGLDGNPEPISSEQRDEVLQAVVDAVLECRSERPLSVGVDGIDGAGKSTFADELAVRLSLAGVRVIRSTIDSFHRPRVERYRKGPSSPAGFYLDSHDLARVRTVLLEPFRNGAGNTLITAAFDAPSDTPVTTEPVLVEAGDVLLFDGIFLHRPELCDYWDFTIFLDAAERVARERLDLVLRDLPVEPVEIVRHSLDWAARIDRYASGQRWYLDTVRPAALADVVVDNNDLACPHIVRRAGVDGADWD